MILTKHLYRLDEVRAAFLYCMLSNRPLDALFWLEELEVSLYGREARRLLFVAWVLYGGVQSLHWVHSWSLISQHKEMRRLLCYQLTRSTKKDSSVWYLLWAAVLDTHNTIQLDIMKLWKYGQSLSEDDFWPWVMKQTTDERIHNIITSLEQDMRSYSLFARASIIAIIYASIHTDPSELWTAMPTSIPQPYHDTFEVWSNEYLTIRKRRVMKIPSDCLFGMTYRGTGQDTTDELRVLNLNSLLHSPYWKQTLVNYTSGGKWLNDYSCEAFWDNHFGPDDIPDEWPLHEQEKSHGQGSTGGIQAPLGRWWRNWIPTTHLLVPEHISRMVENWASTQPIDTYPSVVDRLITAYSQRASSSGLEDCIQQMSTIRL